MRHTENNEIHSTEGKLTGLIWKEAGEGKTIVQGNQTGGLIIIERKNICLCFHNGGPPWKLY